MQKELDVTGGETTTAWTPLAERMRPQTLNEYVGQHHILGEGRLLRRLIEEGRARSIIFYGPAGTGKTTLAKIYAEAIGATFVSISGVMSGVKDVREAVSDARLRSMTEEKATVLFVDEIHRFNKAQQDALLPHVEKGTIILVGATTENPSFEIIKPLHSRARILEIHPLSDDDLRTVIRRALDDDRGLGPAGPDIESDALDMMVAGSRGDARLALNTLEIAADIAYARAKADREPDVIIDVETVRESDQKRAVLYDRAGDEHYQVVSAFIKSMRGGDPDAALYYLVRMLEGGEDPLFILRRMVIFASEDVGNADPHALQVAMNATEAFRFVGMPEGVLPMTQAVTYLASAPKSNAALVAYGLARKDVLSAGNTPVPRHLVNAPTPLMSEMGYGKGYRYPHNFDGHYVPQDYRPERLQGRVYYTPAAEGDEREIAERLRAWHPTRYAAPDSASTDGNDRAPGDTASNNTAPNNPASDDAGQKKR